MPRKHLLLLALIKLNGPVPSRAEWRELGQSCGYSGYRDLAGFFGGRSPSMVRLPDGSRILTEAGWARALSI